MGDGLFSTFEASRASFFPRSVGVVRALRLSAAPTAVSGSALTALSSPLQ